MSEQNPSLYELLLQNFTGELDLHRVREEDQVLLSVLDNLQRILNCRAGTLGHLPDYGLPDMSQILHGMPSSAHSLMGTMTRMLLKYEPRLAAVRADLLPQTRPGHLEYALAVELHDGMRATFGTTLTPEGRVLMRHLKQREYLER
ncbi:type VI secretion system baseplate subunit TssE [Pseudomonas guariconensis]|uniref:type VI secretion system baseplate subunit TssE n=1 Tax=Pseudomonas TaxID=286 RepID=UPI00209787A9|nr:MULTISPECIES: type VI secretion system baseplate subunit TssE [Pseudomonas]MCO7637533.1 type VI secretion system baseplate subunit TssE [Pseudomonas sp. S 311-6]MCO7513953.1 type VI secretion system baseplate subunit TssE [Pseudomonas putida]MCO7563963.1 type VI secretion system baseplate subunit TssE [Pseudomonas mosselii]MCO7604983.1 type VI secretion system baseplate subunit TssE [Pseudomonas guariconensis]MCO7615538.1 type VI secretion system baseplate subunit TssE [Pseudomonas guaricon